MNTSKPYYVTNGETLCGQHATKREAESELRGFRTYNQGEASRYYVAKRCPVTGALVRCK